MSHPHSHDAAMLTTPAYAKAHNAFGRAQMLIKAGVNPFNDRALITPEQQEKLTAFLEKTWHPEGPDTAAEWAMFASKARPWVARTDPADRNALVDSTIKADTAKFYAERPKLTYRPRGGEHPEGTHLEWQQHRRTANATSDLARELELQWLKFKKQHHLSDAMVGNACLGRRTGEAMSPTAAANSLSVLRRENRASGVFYYMNDHPDAFFTRLEELKSAEARTPYHIPAEDRAALTQAVQAASVARKSERGR